MDRFRIVGPCRVTGSVVASGAKNAALPALAASLLTDEPLVLERVPQVRDIATMRRLLERLGVDSEETGGRLELTPTAARRCDAPYDLVKTMRAGVLVLGPLVARRGRARVSLPGGCAIGVRPIDQHLEGLAALGADVELEHGYVEARTDRLRGGRFRFAVRTVTGTENLMMAATLADGTTVLENCAREPEIRDLAELLEAMGARIEGAGEETVTVEGVDELDGAHHPVIADRIEGGTHLLAAAITRGDVTLERCVSADLAPLLDTLERCGAELEVDHDRVRLRQHGPPRPVDVTTAPHPGFPTDLQAQYVALMTQATGEATVTETIFENRFQHVAELLRMGAEIDIERDTARIHGPTPLAGTNVMATDLRASASLVLAALAAEGETLIDRIYHLDRGYERMERKLQGLGVDVERIPGPPTP